MLTVLWALHSNSHINEFVPRILHIRKGTGGKNAKF